MMEIALARWLLALALFNPALDSKDDVPKSVTIEYVNFSLETPWRLECKYFNAMTSVKKLIVTDSNSLKSIARYVHEMSPDTMRECTIDARARLMLLYDDNRIRTLCISLGQICLDGRPMKSQSDFLMFLENLLTKNDKSFRYKY